MGDLAIAICGNDGCAIVIKKYIDISDESSSSNEDPLLQKVIKSNLDIPSEFRECEIKSPSNSLNMAIIVYGNAAERKKIFAIIKDEMRSYLLTFYNPIPLQILADRIGYFVRKFNYFNVEVILASCISLNRYELYSINDKGEGFKCFGCAIGHQKEIVLKKLTTINLNEKNVRQLLYDAAEIASKLSDEEGDIKFSWICDESSGRHQNCEESLISEIMENIL